jgi:hypothetical protein
MHPFYVPRNAPPILADPEIGAVELVSRRDCDLMRDPVDIMVAASSGQFRFEPGFLSPLRIAPDVGVAAVLIIDVIVGDADHAHGAGGEGVPKTTRELRLATDFRQ